MATQKVTVKGKLMIVKSSGAKKPKGEAAAEDKVEIGLDCEMTADELGVILTDALNQLKNKR